MPISSGIYYEYDPVKQRTEALAKANRIRLNRAALKRRIGRFELSIFEVLDHPHCQSMSVQELLMSQRRWGRARANKAREQMGISEIRKVEDLTERQIDALQEYYERKGWM